MRRCRATTPRGRPNGRAPEGAARCQQRAHEPLPGRSSPANQPTNPPNERSNPRDMRAEGKRNVPPSKTPQDSPCFIWRHAAPGAQRRRILAAFFPKPRKAQNLMPLANGRHLACRCSLVYALRNSHLGLIQMHALRTVFLPAPARGRALVLKPTFPCSYFRLAKPVPS